MAPPYEKYDPELAAILAKSGAQDVFDDEALKAQREFERKFDVKKLLEQFPTLEHEEITIEGAHHNTFALSIFRPKDKDKKVKVPGIYYIHGGGMIFGHRFSGIETVLPFVAKYQAVCISVEYRLAPENRAPSATYDCYDGLLWVGENLKELGIDKSKLLILGRSAGAALAAGTVLRMRDYKAGPKICGMILNFPMLDDRSNTNSCKEFEDTKPWSRQSNEYAWKQVLGYAYGTAQVSSYIAPARETDLTRLPPTYIDVGSAEIFRDEANDFAKRLGKAKVSVEFVQWEGGYHCFDNVKGPCKLRDKAIKARYSWMERVLGLKACGLVI